MTKDEILAKAQELIGEGQIDAAQEFIDSHKEDLGGYFDQAKELFSSNEGITGIFDTIKGFFGK